MSNFLGLGAAILSQGFTVINLGEERIAPPPMPPKQSDESKQLHLSRAEAKRQRRAQRNLRAQS